MRDIRSDSGVISLLLANSVPLFGVLFFDWSLYLVIFLYWFENVVIGVFNVARMARATGVMPEGAGVKLNGQPYVPAMKMSLIVFFIFHYGIFVFVHGVFVSAMFGSAGGNWRTAFVAMVSLMASHWISYRVNYIGKREYERVSAPELFIHPYKRIVVLHVAILIGGLASQALGAPVLALVILIGLKTLVDLKVHNWEHRIFSPKNTSIPIVPSVA